MKTRTLLAAACTTALAVTGSMEAATIGTINTQLFTGTGAQSYDATGADKLVVMIGTESGFNNQQITGVTMKYNDVDMVLAASDNTWNQTNDGGYIGIFYLDDPNQGTANITWSATTTGGGPNGARLTVLGLTDTLDGVGDTDSSGTASTSITTTGNDSLVFAAHENSGTNNIGGNPAATAPLTQIHSGNWSNWAGVATAQQSVAASGTTITPTFTTNPTTANIHTAAAEFLVVPEPSSLALLGLGGLLIARRRRG